MFHFHLITKHENYLVRRTTYGLTTYTEGTTSYFKNRVNGKQEANYNHQGNYLLEHDYNFLGLLHHQQTTMYYLHLQ